MNRVAVVTGAGRGIGRASSLALARAGYSVAAVARTVDEIEETARLARLEGVPAVAVTCDIGDPAQVAQAHAAVQAQLGDVDLLINNAGRNQAVGPIWELDMGEWWTDLAVNLLGSALWCAQVMPAMTARGEGRIVNLTSGTAGRAVPYDSGYATAKAAVVRLTDCLAAEGEPHGVRVFALRPGTVHTKLNHDYAELAAKEQRLGLDSMAGLTFVPVDLAADAVVLLGSGQADVLSGRWLDATEDILAVVAQADTVARDDLYQLRRRTLS